MPTMTIRVVNTFFESISAGEFATIDDAYCAAIVAGLEIAVNEVRTGSDSAVVEVAVDLVGKRGVARGAVAISTGRFSGAPSA